MTEAIERWLPIAGYEGLYEVSSLGRVKSIARNTSTGVRGWRVLSPATDSGGYPQVYLCKAGTQRLRKVHHLVAEAFIGPRLFGMECCHNDGVPSNNNLANLRWDTATGNQSDKVKHGTHSRGDKNGRSKLTPAQVVAIRADPRSNCETAADYGITNQMVSFIRNRKSWAHIA